MNKVLHLAPFAWRVFVGDSKLFRYGMKIEIYVLAIDRLLAANTRELVCG